MSTISARIGHRTQTHIFAIRFPEQPEPPTSERWRSHFIFQCPPFVFEIWTDQFERCKFEHSTLPLSNVIEWPSASEGATHIVVSVIAHPSASEGSKNIVVSFVAQPPAIEGDLHSSVQLIVNSIVARSLFKVTVESPFFASIVLIRYSVNWSCNGTVTPSWHRHQELLSSSFHLKARGISIATSSLSFQLRQALILFMTSKFHHFCKKSSLLCEGDMPYIMHVGSKMSSNNSR